jgi:hypothetical protein
MNTLDYRCTKDNGLSFELLVDGQPLGALIGSIDLAFPYWIVENDLPHWPPHGTPRDPEIRIVCVCECGEYGCGHAQCRVLHEHDSVIFRNFDFDVSSDGREKEFRFAAANYKAVVDEIVQMARAKRTE